MGRLTWGYGWENVVRTGLKPMTQAERRRAEVLKREIGCIACRQLGYQRQADLHHLVEGYRVGHAISIPLCPWHHRGIPDGTRTASMMEAGIGPSLARSKRQFVERFGSERELLDEANRLYQEFEGRVIR